MALRPNAAISPHSNPNLAYLLVIEGGGWVAVGQERARVSAGDAVVWPPNVIHAAWTESTPMRAIVVEFVAAADESPALLLDGLAGSEAPHAAALPEVGAAPDGRLAPADGRLAPSRRRTRAEPAIRPPSGPFLAGRRALVGGPARSRAAAYTAPIGDLSQSIATSWFRLAWFTATDRRTPGAMTASFDAGTRWPMTAGNGSWPASWT